MKRKSVDSSTLASVGYDQSSETLEIEFKYGGIYQYFDVPNEAYDALMDASSPGTFFDINIKKRNYDYKKIN